jgi:hypothetical protein
MTAKTNTRRAFLKGAAIAAAPVTAAAGAAGIAVNEHEAKLARLQAEAEVRALHQDWLRKVAAGDRAEAGRLGEGVTAVTADHAGEPDRIVLMSDGRRAEGRYACVVETETARPLDCTLAQMAAAQGEGLVRARERRVLTADYVRTDKGWAIAKLGVEPA